MTLLRFYFIALLLTSICVYTNGDTGFDYGMVIDAGSTHSALYIYKFENRITSDNIPPQSAPRVISHSNDTGPIGELTSQSACDTLISTLTSFAKAQLMEDEARWYEFPIYLKATAGMRVLPNDDRERILGYVENSFSDPDINPFRFDTTYAIIASGEEEATFDWLGVNFIYNRLVNNDSDESTYGALDLGGQSTQIAFAPEPQSNILADFTAVRLWQRTHRLYTHSFLRYGTNAIANRIAQIAYDEANDTSNITNACLNPGASDTFLVQNDTGATINVTQIGNSMDDLSKCRTWMKSLLANDTECYVKDCAFNGVYLAEIPDGMTFIAFSAFAYAVGGLGLSDSIDLRKFYYNDTMTICNSTLGGLYNSTYNNSNSYPFMDTYCRLNTYMFVLLHEGYGFDLDNTPIIFTNSYNHTPITWTQGSILRDSNWLPYDVDYIQDNDDSGLNTQGKAWRAATITLVTILAIVLLGCVFMVYKIKSSGSGTYTNMDM